MSAINYRRLLEEERRKAKQNTQTNSQSQHAEETKKQENSVKNVQHKNPPPEFNLEPLSVQLPILNNRNYMVGNLDTIYYVPDFLSANEEQSMLEQVNYHYNEEVWTELRGRRLQNWGGIPHPSGMLPVALPSYLNTISNRLLECGIFTSCPNHVLINQYQCGDGIMPHKDGPLYHSLVAILSTGSSAVMQFRREFSREVVMSLFLQPRSLLIFTDEAYTEFLHGIEESNCDVLDEKVVNRQQLGYQLGMEVPRDKRISFTIRIVLKVLDPDSEILHTDSALEDMRDKQGFWFRAINEKSEEYRV